MTARRQMPAVPLKLKKQPERFRAVCSFGPVEDVRGYGPEYVPFAATDPREAELRAPGRWLACVKSPTFVFEGTSRGNVDSLQAMARSSSNPKAQFFAVRGANHFSLLAPTNRLLADRILHDDGPACNLTFTAEELSKPFGK